MPHPSQSRSWPPRLALPLVFAATVLLFLAVEGAASVSLALEAAHRDAVRAERSGGILEQRHCEYDRDLGWMHRPNVAIEGLYEPGTRFTTNSQRLRATRDYTREVPADRYRVVCLGDSFTMGYGVDDAETFPAQLEANSDRLEVINMGMGAFGIDQDYLWYLRDGERFETDLLLLLVVLDDFDRMTTNKFSGLFPKPLLDVRDGDLVVDNVPVPRMFSREERAAHGPGPLARVLRHLSFSRSVAPRISARDGGRKRRVTARLLTDLRDVCRERGQEFGVVYLPMDRRIVRMPERASIVRWLRDFAAAEEIPFYDLVPRFAEVLPEELTGYFAHDHYSPRGNALIARALREIIGRDFLEY